MGRALWTMPKMTDVRAGAVFRPVGSDQLFATPNAVDTESGTAVGDHRRHMNSSIPIPDGIIVASRSIQRRLFFSESREIRCRIALFYDCAAMGMQNRRGPSVLHRNRQWLYGC